MPNHKKMHERDREHKKRQESFNENMFADLATLALLGIISTASNSTSSNNRKTSSKPSESTPADDALGYGCGAGCGTFFLIWIICDIVGAQLYDPAVEEITYIIIPLVFVLTYVLVRWGNKSIRK